MLLDNLTKEQYEKLAKFIGVHIPKVIRSARVLFPSICKPKGYITTTKLIRDYCVYKFIVMDTPSGANIKTVHEYICMFEDIWDGLPDWARDIPDEILNPIFNETS